MAFPEYMDFKNCEKIPPYCQLFNIRNEKFFLSYSFILVCLVFLAASEYLDNMSSKHSFVQVHRLKSAQRQVDSNFLLKKWVKAVKTWKVNRKAWCRICTAFQLFSSFCLVKLLRIGFLQTIRFDSIHPFSGFCLLLILNSVGCCVDKEIVECWFNSVVQVLF